jgi:hypothetical protein
MPEQQLECKGWVNFIFKAQTSWVHLHFRHQYHDTNRFYWKI